MFNAVLYFLLGTLRVLAGAFFGLLAVAFIIKGEGTTLLNGFAYLVCMAVGFGLVAWGAVYFSVAGEHAIGWEAFAVCGAVAMLSIAQITLIFVGVMFSDRGLLSLALYAPVLLAIAWTFRNLIRTILEYRNEERTARKT